MFAGAVDFKCGDVAVFGHLFPSSTVVATEVDAVGGADCCAVKADVDGVAFTFAFGIATHPDVVGAGAAEVDAVAKFWAGGCEAAVDVESIIRVGDHAAASAECDIANRDPVVAAAAGVVAVGFGFDDEQSCFVLVVGSRIRNR